MLEHKEFFGTWNQENKDFWISTMQDHQDADRLISGEWFREDGYGFKGCFFGCAMQTDESPLEKAISAMGLPPWFIYLAERIYEGLSHDVRVSFPVRLLKSIPVGVDLEPVRHRIAIARLSVLAEKNASVSECINSVIELHKLSLDGEIPSSSCWTAAALSAAETAESAEPAEFAALTDGSAWSAEFAAESAGHHDMDAAWSAESMQLIKELSLLEGDQSKCKR